MKYLMLALLACLGSSPLLQAAEDPDPAPPTNRPSPEDLRTRFRRLNREDRDTRLKELRGRLNDSTNRSELEKRREEWRKLPPAEREARIREFRDRNLNPDSPRFNRLTPEQRETKRAELKARLDAQVKILEARRATAPLSEQEERRLERFQRMSRRLDRAASANAGGPKARSGPDAGAEGTSLPPPKNSAPKP